MMKTSTSESISRQQRHDSRNLLNAIIGYSGLLQEDAEESGQQGFLPGLSNITLAAKQLLAYVEDGAMVPGLENKMVSGHGQGSQNGNGTDLAAKEGHETDQPTTAGTASQEGGNLLVVDDDEMARDILSRCLERQGHTVSMATNGLHALEMIRSNQFELVLLDIMMPELDGYQVLARVKADSGLREIPVIMLSALGDMDSVVKCIEMGAEDYLPKPFDPVLLKARIGAVLEKRRLETGQRRQLQDQLRQAQKMESVGRLVGGVAHDFNNMLSVIIGYTEQDIRKLPPSESEKLALPQVLQAAIHSAKLTRTLLAFSHRQVVEPLVLDLNEALLNLYKMARRLISADIELVILPSAEPCLVSMDPQQVKQVLLNLSINASDAMPHGGKLVMETTNAVEGPDLVSPSEPESEGQYVLLTVSDTGTGMTPEIKECIFEPFFTTKETGKGTGLGLATCASIVKESGGHIDVGTSPGRGTSFKIYLPRVDQSAATKIATESTTDLPPLAYGSETVLVVEDEASLRLLMVDLLKAQGYTVLSASNGIEAVEAARKHGGQRIDLLFTDVVMPQMSGTELAERFRQTHPGTKVLFTSGYGAGPTEDQTDPGQGGEFLEKPFSSGSLLLKVREALDRGTPNNGSS